MKITKLTLSSVLLLICSNAFAKFGSEQELFNAFNSIGMNVVVEITDVNSAKNLLVHSTSQNSTSSIDQFSEVTPMSTLDYVEEGTFTNTNYKAFSVAEIVLCYSSDKQNVNRSIYVSKNKFEKCYMLPNKIRDVVSKIQSL